MRKSLSTAKNGYFYDEIPDYTLEQLESLLDTVGSKTPLEKINSDAYTRLIRRWKKRIVVAAVSGAHRVKRSCRVIETVLPDFSSRHRERLPVCCFQ